MATHGVPTWSVGVIINIIGSVSINFGTNLMKLSHNDKDQMQRAIELAERHSATTPGPAAGGAGSGSSSGTNRQQQPSRPSPAGNSSSSQRASQVDPTHPAEEQEAEEDNVSLRTAPPSSHQRRTWIEYRNQLLSSFHRGLRLFNLSPRTAHLTGDDDEHSPPPRQRWSWTPRQPLSTYLTPDRPIKQLLREKLWHIGALVLLAGSICTFVSFAYAPQSMLAALGSVQFVSNVVFARFVLGEQITLRVIVATAIIVAGQVLIVVYSSHESNNYDAHSLLALYDRIFLTYMGVLAIVGGFLTMTYRHYRKREAEGHELPYADTVLPVTYAMASAMIGTFSVLQAKCLSELLGRTLRGDNQLRYFFTWAVLFLWLFLTVFWLHRMNTALRLFDGVFIIPILQVFWTLFAVINGGLFFHEFQDAFTPKMVVWFVVGIATIFFGVFLLSPRQAQVEEEDFQAITDDEGALAWRGMASEEAEEEEESKPSPGNPPPPPPPRAGGAGRDEGSFDSASSSKGGCKTGGSGDKQEAEQQQQGPRGPHSHSQGTSVAAAVDQTAAEEMVPGGSATTTVATDLENQESAFGVRMPSLGASSNSSRKLQNHNSRLGSLEVLHKHNSCLFSLNTMPFLTNDEGLTHFIENLATPEEGVLPRSARVSPLPAPSSCPPEGGQNQGPGVPEATIRLPFPPPPQSSSPRKPLATTVLLVEATTSSRQAPKTTDEGEASVAAGAL